MGVVAGPEVDVFVGSGAVAGFGVVAGSDVAVDKGASATRGAIAGLGLPFFVGSCTKRKVSWKLICCSIKSVKSTNFKLTFEGSKGCHFSWLSNLLLVQRLARNGRRVLIKRLSVSGASKVLSLSNLVAVT